MQRRSIWSALGCVPAGSRSEILTICQKDSSVSHPLQARERSDLDPSAPEWTPSRSNYLAPHSIQDVRLATEDRKTRKSIGETMQYSMWTGSWTWTTLTNTVSLLWWEHSNLLASIQDVWLPTEDQETIGHGAILWMKCDCAWTLGWTLGQGARCPIVQAVSTKDGDTLYRLWRWLSLLTMFTTQTWNLELMKCVEARVQPPPGLPTRSCPHTSWTGLHSSRPHAWLHTRLWSWAHWRFAARDCASGPHPTDQSSLMLACKTPTMNPWAQCQLLRASQDWKWTL